MKNIWNDPRSLFNGNHFSSILLASERSERDTLRSVQLRIADIYIYIYIYIYIVRAILFL